MCVMLSWLLNIFIDECKRKLQVRNVGEHCSQMGLIGQQFHVSLQIILYWLQRVVGNIHI